MIKATERYDTRHKVRLSALDLTVKLEKNQGIIDHGRIDHMVEHTRQWLKERNMPHDDEYIRNEFGLNACWWNSNLTGGNYINRTLGGITTKHIRYISSGHEDEDLFVRGHEETHVLEDFEKIEVVEEELQRVFRKKLHLPHYHGETIANTGGILAVKKTGKSDAYIVDLLSSMIILDGERYKQESLEILGFLQKYEFNVRSRK